MPLPHHISRLLPAVVIGGGPAGLFAAETLSSHGIETHLFEGKPSVGRKFLVAGSSGLNLTNALDPKDFPSRFTGPEEIWKSLLSEFPPQSLRDWAAGLGIATYEGSSGKIFPEGQQAAPLLRRWVSRLRNQGVLFHTRRRWLGIEPVEEGWDLEFSTPAGETIHIFAKCVILALGGGSWPETGSDGAWVAALRSKGIEVTPLSPANCGFEVEWPALVRGMAGAPLKNIQAKSGGRSISGECTITEYGLEGGVIYQLGREIRETRRLLLDLKPQSSLASLIKRLERPKGALLSTARRRWNLCPATVALLDAHSPWREPAKLAEAAKCYEVELKKSRPLEEAISSAGGVVWEELTSGLMLKGLPGVFVAGEMIDWEAPTGGFLLQGSFATGRHAALSATKRFRSEQL